ncbi:Dual specificity phosphatase catalytic domain [Trypanosoma vivax]|nr:Dual specificity phosphatase catalytic domain [Trypanosoma vivax]
MKGTYEYSDAVAPSPVMPHDTCDSSPELSTLAVAELDRFFAILRFVSTCLACDGDPCTGGGSCHCPASVCDTGAPADSRVMPVHVAEALEDLRMAVTNVPVHMDVITGARTALHAVLLETYPQHAGAVNALCGSSSFHACRTTTLPLRGFMRRRVYLYQSMQQIVPGLFVGSYHPASDRELLLQHGITHIVCCIDVPPRFPKDFVYMRVAAQDSPGYNIARFFPRTNDFIERALMNPDSAVLVHCGAGISRAPTVAAYLMKALRLPADAVVVLLHERRPVVSPNAGFRRQLREYQRSLVCELPGSAGKCARVRCSALGELLNFLSVCCLCLFFSRSLLLLLVPPSMLSRLLPFLALCVFLALWHGPRPGKREQRCRDRGKVCVCVLWLLKEGRTTRACSGRYTGLRGDCTALCLGMLGSGKSSGVVNEAANLKANQNLTSAIEQMGRKSIFGAVTSATLYRHIGGRWRRPARPWWWHDFAAFDPAVERMQARVERGAVCADDGDDSELQELRRRRVTQMKQLHAKEAEWRAKQHGQYREISQDEFFTTVVRTRAEVTMFACTSTTGTLRRAV